MPKKAVAKLISLVILFIFLLNGTAFFYLKRYNPNLGYEINSRKWEILKTLDEKKDWLILGDSTCNQGLSVETFNQELNTSAINLCTIGAMLTVDDSWMLKTYIRQFGPPKNVLIIHGYDIWQRKDINLALASQLPIWHLLKEKPEPWNLNLKEEITLVLYKYFPLYSQKDSLSEIISSLFKKNVPSDRSFDESGFMSMKNADVQSVSEDRDGHISFLENRQFEMSSDNFQGLNNIKHLSDKYGFDIIIANAPVNEKLAENDSFKIYFLDIKEYLSEYAQTNGIYYLEDLYTYPDDKMVSVDHVILEAAIDYSRKISDDISTLVKN